MGVVECISRDDGACLDTVGPVRLHAFRKRLGEHLQIKLLLHFPRCLSSNPFFSVFILVSL